MEYASGWEDVCIATRLRDCWNLFVAERVCVVGNAVRVKTMAL
jgi:hypothetical protein